MSVLKYRRRYNPQTGEMEDLPIGKAPKRTENELLQELLTNISSIDEEIRRTAGVAWYRGHSDCDWQIRSSLHRHMLRLTSTVDEPHNMRELMRGEYKTLYQGFKSEAWSLLDETARSEWGVIFAMQHYGIPTRLLDWTESFGCALFFAQYGRIPGDRAAVWVLNPERLNERMIGQNGIITFDELASENDLNGHPWHPRYKPPEEDLPTIAVAPIFSNARMMAQRSKFTVSGDSFLSLEKQLGGDLMRDRIILKLEIPAGLFAALNNYLRVAGFRPFTFFPDLEGLRLEHEARVRKTLNEIELFVPEQLRRPQLR